MESERRNGERKRQRMRGKRKESDRKTWRYTKECHYLLGFLSHSNRLKQNYVKAKTATSYPIHVSLESDNRILSNKNSNLLPYLEFWVYRVEQKKCC